MIPLAGICTKYLTSSYYPSERERKKQNITLTADTKKL